MTTVSPYSDCLRKLKAAKIIHYLFQPTVEDRASVSRPVGGRSLTLISSN